MLKNKPNLPRVIKDINGHNNFLEISFGRDEELCYIEYGFYYYGDYEPMTVGGNPIQTSSKYIEDAWDDMLELLEKYGFLDREVK